MIDKEALRKYYSNLLIIQYHNKPKAISEIELLSNTMTGDYLIADLIDLLDVDIAVGQQLDFIGKIVGIDRFYITPDITGVQFALLPYDVDPSSVPDDTGFKVYSDFDTKLGLWISYNDIIGTNRQLNDDDFRFLIKLKIVLNFGDAKHKSIDDSLFSFFGLDVVADTRDDMEMNYFIAFNLSAIIQAALYKEVLPKPLGVGLKYFIKEQNPFYGYATYSNFDPLAEGFSTYLDFDTKLGDFLTYSELLEA